MRRESPFAARSSKFGSNQVNDSSSEESDCESQNLLPHLMPRMSGRQSIARNSEKIYGTPSPRPTMEIYENPSEYNFGSQGMTSFNANNVHLPVLKPADVPTPYLGLDSSANSAHYFTAQGQGNNSLCLSLSRQLVGLHKGTKQMVFSLVSSH